MRTTSRTRLWEGDTMIDVYRSDDDTHVGSISSQDLDFLVEHLEEEDLDDMDYYVDRDTIDYLKEQGASAALISLLEQALGDRDAVEIYYFAEDEALEPDAEEET